MSTTSFKDDLVSLIPRLRAHARVLLRSSLEADDLVQDTLVRAWKFRDTFRPGTNMGAWLFRILRNEYLNQVSKPRARVSFVGEDYRLEFSCEPDQEWRSTYSELLEALNELPEANREALLLVGGCGFSYEEAAEICGCAPGTVKSRVSRARDRLAVLMDYDVPRGVEHALLVQRAAH